MRQWRRRRQYQRSRRPSTGETRTEITSVRSEIRVAADHVFHSPVPRWLSRWPISRRASGWIYQRLTRIFARATAPLVVAGGRISAWGRSNRAASQTSLAFLMHLHFLTTTSGPDRLSVSPAATETSA